MSNYLSFLIVISILSNSNLFAQNSNPIFTVDVEEVIIDPDSLVFPYLQEYFDSDSIQVFKYEKIYLEGESDPEERIVFIDYRNDTKVKNGYRGYREALRDFEIIEEKDNYYETGPDSVKTILNIFPELKNIYVPVYIFKNSIVGFEGESYRKVAIKDSGFIFHDWEGWLQQPIISAEKSGDIYRFIIIDYDEVKDIIEIVQVSEYIQIWKITSKRYSQIPSVSYKFMAPLTVALKLPTLEPLYTAGEDGVFEEFDDFNFEQYFQ